MTAAAGLRYTDGVVLRLVLVLTIALCACRKNDVRASLEKAGFKAALAEVTMKAASETEFAGEDAARMQKLLDAIESLDDVQDVYTNAVLDG